MISISGRKFVIVSNSNPTSVLNNAFDHAYYVNTALTLAGGAAQNGVFTGSVPDAKGGQSLGAYAYDQSINQPPLATATQPAAGGLFRSAGSGFIDHDNQPGPYYTHQFDITTGFPCEVHFVGVILQLFPNEAYYNILGIYGSDLNLGNFRTTNNDADPNSRIVGLTLPVGKPFHVAMVYAADKTVSVYVDGVLKGSGRTSQWSAFGGNLTRLGVATNTNNAKWFSSGVFFANRQLSSQEKTDTDAAIKTLFNTEVDLAYPVYQNVSLTGNGTNTITASGTYFSPDGVAENTALRKVLWYGAGNNPAAPDVTNQVHYPSLDNLMSWTKTGFPTEYAANKQWRVDIACTDINGKSFGGSCGVQFYYFG